MINITKWIHSNKLSLNIEKTSYMIMSPPRKKLNTNNCNIVIDGDSIVRVNNIKFLGVVIDENMTWKYHTDFVCNKMSKSVGILLRARQMLYGHTLHMLYNSLIKPHLVYCITVWGNSYKKYLSKIQLVQKRAIRVITFSEFLAHTTPLFIDRDIMPVYQLHAYFTGIMIFQSLHNELPNYLCNLFCRNFNERNSTNLRSIYMSKKFTQFSIRSVGPRIWNSFTLKCKQATSLYSFKKLLRSHLILSHSNEWTLFRLNWHYIDVPHWYFYITCSHI